MKIGISTYDLKNRDFQIQLNSLLEQGLHVDFIVLHYGSFFGKYLKYLRFVLKTIKQYKLGALQQLRKKVQIKSTENHYKLNDQQQKNVNDYLAKARILKTLAINDKSTIRKLKLLEKALIVSNSGILKSPVLALENIIFINIHASKLPLYRGMNNIEWALYENNELYLTIHRIARGIDEGEILLQEKISTDSARLKSISDYRNFCFFQGNQLIGKAVKLYLERKIDFVPQEITGNPLHQYYFMHPILKRKLEQKLAQT